MNSILLFKEQMEEKLESLKISSKERFNALTEYLVREVEGWLVCYVKKNDDVEDTLHQLTMDFKERNYKIHPI
jgi:hypothetical protein